MNKCVITGRISKDLELKRLKENCVCEFTLATNRLMTRDGKKVADFINCIVWGTQAENLVKYQRKGNMLGVFGEIRTDKFEVEGNTRYKTYVLVNNIEFLESKKDMSKEESTEFDKISSKTETQTSFEYDDTDLPWND